MSGTATSYAGGASGSARYNQHLKSLGDGVVSEGGMGLAYLSTAASSAITGTNDETMFSTRYAIPANTLEAGTLISVRFQGIVTGLNGADEVVIKLWLATTTTAGALAGITLISMASTAAAASTVFQGEYEMIVRTAGATGTVVGVGTYKSIPAAEGTMTIKDDILASTALDTTVAQTVGVSADWNSASGTNSCRLDFLRVEIWNN